MKLKRSRKDCPKIRVYRRGGWFQKFSRGSARFTGHPISFGLAIAVILTWLATGPIFHFSDTWQLVINTGTTIVTFLMVFLIQNTQNRDSSAVQLKLDELIRSSKGCHNMLLDIEELSQEELDRLKLAYEDLAMKAIKDLRSGKSDIGTPEIKDYGDGPSNRTRNNDDAKLSKGSART